MIQDDQTNFLYLADSLSKKYPDFYRRFVNVLEDTCINYALLPGTKDVWAVDYMPVQVSKNRFIQFFYNPDYLRSTVKWSKTISDVDSICRSIGIVPERSDIVLDGGNVIRSNSKVIMCDKVFSENPGIPPDKLIDELQQLLQVDKIIFIPTDPSDFTGHADGMVRFYNDDTVLVNDYSKEDRGFQKRLLVALKDAGLTCIEIPYNPSNNKKNDQANGIFINYLEMKQGIIIPVYGMQEDILVVKQFEQLFPGHNIKSIDSSEIALDGGVLNCITWNILKD